MSDRLKNGYKVSNPKPGDEVLITGLAGYFPESNSVAELQENLFNKVHLVTNDDRRWKYTTTDIPQAMGKIKNLNNFDASFFGLDFKVVHRLDAQCRLLLERTYEAIIDAGMNPAEFRNSRTGIFIGCSLFDSDRAIVYGRLNSNEQNMIRNSIGSIAANIGQWLGVNGQASTMDSACSSALYALENAFKAIRNGNCDAAIVGGVNICLHILLTAQFSKLGILSPHGVCKCFDASANGYVRSEAATIIILQKAKDSRRAYAQIVYSKANCDGFKDNGITYPSGIAQRCLLKEFYEECNISPTSLEYIEAHGTGTVVGDLEELNAIDDVLCKDRTGPLLIGSTKSNLGHSEAASGVTSAIKLCIAYHSGFIPPNLNYNEPRKEVSGLVNGKLKVVTEKQAWNRGLSCFSAFGFGGANAHILLKNFDKEKINNGKPNDNLPRLVCVSGRTKSAVERVLCSLAARPIDAEEIRLWHAINEKNIEGHKFRGFTLLKSTPAGTVTLAHDVVSYKNTQRPSCLVYPSASSQLRNVKELMDIPQFVSAISKCDTALKAHVNLMEIITGNLPISSKNLNVAIVAIQIALTDVIRSVGFKPDICVGYGIGELGCAYAKGTLTALEAIQLAYVQGLNLPETSDRELTAEGIIPLIPPNAVVIQVTPGPNLKNTLKSNFNTEIEIEVSLIEKTTDNAVQDLFIGLGRLFEAGKTLKLAELYPHVQYPVSQGTPMLSHLVEWDHREKWYTFCYRDEKPKLNGTDRVVPISMENPDLYYLDGHYIDGRHLYPGSGYLQLVWETFALMHGERYNEFSVVFENIQFLRATTIPVKDELLFVISIHPVTGEFEITENKTAVASGVIYHMKDAIKSREQSSLENLDNPESIKLSEKDIYREIKLRGYGHSDKFRGVVDSNLDCTYCRVKWLNNWITYLDYIFQTVLMKADTRLLYLPTGLAKLSIDTELHRSILTKISETTKQFYMDVFLDDNTQTIRCGGVEIQEFNIAVVSRKPERVSPIFEIYKFVPNYVKDLCVLENVIRTFVDIVLENTQVYKFNAIELIDEDHKRKNNLTLEYVDTLLEVIPQVMPELIIVTKEEKAVKNNDNQPSKIPPHFTELKTLPTNKNAVLLIGVNLSRKEKVLKESDACLREGGFILSIEEDDTTATKISDEFDIVAMNNTGEEVVVLYKKKADIKKVICFKVEDTIDHSFLWVEKLKDAIAMKHVEKIILYANDDISGIMGLVNCLRRESPVVMIQCLFVIDSDAPPFKLELPFYRDQLNKNLACNIYKDGQWGTFRHAVMKNLDVVKPSQHAYVNVENIGDLSSLKWFEGNLKVDIDGKNEDLLLVHVYSAALNFRDVMTATGRVAVDAVVKGRLAQECVQGLEFAGKLANGMRVFGMAEKCISNVLLCKPGFLAVIPEEWTFDEAASVFVAYATVYIALDMFGKIKPGESILIHAGSGAVGQAAIKVALRRGCNVFTTVGTPEKRKFIKKLFPQLNDNHIGNSRDTSFEEMIKEQTNGNGVDLVLNSLAEDKLLASVRCLGRKGRFLEIGKYDIFKNTTIEMSFIEKEISFHGIMLENTDEAATKLDLFELMTKGIAANEISPITHCTFEKHDVEAAYRYMATGKHIGKVIIKIRDDDGEKYAKPQPLLVDAHRRYICRKDYVYILVGGLGGFGLELADWLVLRGARKLILVSTKGISTGYQAKRIKIWRSYGANIRVLTDDVTTESGCKKILEIANSMGHVEAIFNLAGILNDALFQQQTPESYLKSFRPKAFATFYLDKLSRNMCPGLQDFVAFSSYSCGRGNSGQSNYGLANSVMERICEKRKQDGFPALAIQWGAIGDVGMVAELQSEKGLTDIAGIMPQRIHSCLQALDVFMTQSNTIVSCYMIAQKKVMGNTKKTVVETVAKIIGVKDMKAISYQVSLPELGMDSIAALEVLQTLEREFDIVVTSQDIKTMSFAKLISLESEFKESNSNSKTSQLEATVKKEKDGVFDFNYFIRSFGDEKNAVKPFIIMPTKSVTHNKGTKNKTLFMIPGLDGSANSLEPLCRQLDIDACVLQLVFNKSICDLEAMTDKLYEVIKPLIAQTSSFNLLGYSYGTVLVLALAAKLENEGHMGTVFCIDGSPKWLKTLFTDTFNVITEDELKEAILMRVLEITLPSDGSYLHRLEKVSEITSYDDKINYVIDQLPKDLENSKEFIKLVNEQCNKRLKMVNDYKIEAFKKIKSPIVLIRPDYVENDKFSKDYDLNQFTEGDVNVHYLKGNHVSIIADPNCAAIIDKYLNE